MPRWPKTVQERFERNYIPEPNTGCWLWLGYLTRNDGYGRLMDGVYKMAHRLAWELFRGSIPARMSVLHRCDNPCCVNPDHLFVGTQKDNMADMTKKGRNAMVKISDEIASIIRASAETPTVLAKRFGISATHACAIQKGRKR